MLLVVQLGWDHRFVVSRPLPSIPLFCALVILASVLVTSLFKALPALRRVV